MSKAEESVDALAEESVPRPSTNSHHRRSSVIEAHNVYLKYHRDLSTVEDGAAQARVDFPLSAVGDLPSPPPAAARRDAFRQFHRVEKTGVIYATSRASAHGFDPEDPSWANMGQGAPETGPLEHAPPRNFALNVPDPDLEYAPVTGLHELRAKVAAYYNHLYRKG